MQTFWHVIAGKFHDSLPSPRTSVTLLGPSSFSCNKKSVISAVCWCRATSITLHKKRVPDSHLLNLKQADKLLTCLFNRSSLLSGVLQMYTTWPCSVTKCHFPVGVSHTNTKCTLWHLYSNWSTWCMSPWRHRTDGGCLLDLSSWQWS